MKKTIALFALATLLFASGCIGPSLLEQERFKVKDRGAPVECATGECFLKEFKRCGPSRFFVQEEGVKLKSEVHGRSAFGDCVVYVRVEDVNPDEVPQEMKLVAGGLKGMDMALSLIHI